MFEQKEYLEKKEKEYKTNIKKLEDEIIKINELYKSKGKSGEKDNLRKEIITKQKEIQKLKSLMDENEIKNNNIVKEKETIISNLKKEIWDNNEKLKQNQTKIKDLTIEKNQFE